MTKAVIVKAKSKGPAYWADRVNASWGKAAEHFMECGRILLEARRDLTTNEWKQMYNRLEIDESKVSKLMSIAKNPVIGKVSFMKVLPPNYTTMYTLTHLPEDALKKAFKKGDIHPNMSHGDAEKLVEKAQPKPEPVSREADDLDPDEEYVEDVEPEAEEDDEPEEKPSKPTKVIKPVPIKGGFELALSNWDGALDSALDFSGMFEEAYEKSDDEVPKEVKDKAERLNKWLTRFLKKL